MSVLRVGVVGAGRRVLDMYAPVLGELRDDFEVVGVTSRTAAAARRAAEVLRVRPHRDIQALVRDARPEILVVAVYAPANGAVALAAIETGCAVLLETPVAQELVDARRVTGVAARARAPVGVAEQKPFLPWEYFKRQLIEAGALGQVIVTENDYRSYDYHAIAQLRRYLSPDAVPRRAQATRATFALDSYARAGEGGATTAGPRVEQWEIGTVTMDDGSLLIHRYTSASKVAPFRTFQSLRIYGTRGSAVNDEIVVLDAQQRSVRLRVEETGAARSGLAPASIAVTLPDGEVVAWENPFAGRGFTDDQVAVALHLIALRDAVAGRGAPLYTSHDALRDIEALDAFRRSAAADGAPVDVRHTCGDPRCTPVTVLKHAVRFKTWVAGPRGRALILRLRGRAARHLRRVF